jgi:hypothetical protein
MITFQEFTAIDEEVNTSSYEGAHMKKPKGSGNWIFSKHRNHSFKTHPDSDSFSHTGSYGEAKAKAKKYFTSKGHTGTIHLQS